MQTFLPYRNFRSSAAALDRQRLGKQRVEVRQLLDALLGEGSRRWRSHPAARMWADHELALWRYGVAVCDEWRARGYRDTVRDYLAVRRPSLEFESRCHGDPPWLGDDAFHASHRSNLYRKNPVHYAEFADVGPDLPYVWPTPVCARECPCTDDAELVRRAQAASSICTVRMNVI